MGERVEGVKNVEGNVGIRCRYGRAGQRAVASYRRGPRPHRTDDRPTDRAPAEDFAGREINENAARMQIVAQSDNWIGPAVVRCRGGASGSAFSFY